MTFGPSGPNTTTSQETSQNASFERAVVAGEALAAFDAVYQDTADSGKAKKAINNDTVLKADAIGIVKTSVLDDGTGTVVTKGPITNPAWSWTVGGEVYVGATAGALTQTIPTTGNVKPMGKAVSATSIDLDPDTGWSV